MPKFCYRYKDQQGKVKTGVLEADSLVDARTGLENKEYQDIMVYLQHRDGLGGRKVSLKEIAVFCRQLSALLIAGITVYESLTVVVEQTANARLKKAIIKVREDMDGGMSFAQAFSRQQDIFPGYLMDMVQIGQESGTLDNVMSTMADYYEKDVRMRRKIRSAVTYPIILAVLMMGVIALLIFQVLPMFNRILQSVGGEIPLVTKLLMDVSLFVSQYAVWFLLGILVIIAAVYLFSKTVRGRFFFDKQKMHFSLFWLLNRRTATSRFARSLAIFIKSGIGLLPAIEMLAPLMGNSYVQSKLERSIGRIRGGESLAAALTEQEIFPPLLIRMLAVGENTGHLDDMLSRTSMIFDEEVDEALERVTTIIEPVLIIVLSVIVAIILLSVMLPMINIMSSIG